jgi:quinol monooxygenase YgiN
MRQSLFVFAKITAKPEHLEDAKQAILGILEPTLSEAGCKQFVLHEGHGDGCLYLYEEWSDEAALAAHYAQTYTAEVFRSYQDWLAQPVEVTKLTKLN